MPRILLPLPAEPLSTLGQKSFVRASYIRKLAAYDLSAICVSPFSLLSHIDDTLSLCSGVLLMGGLDIDPSHYGDQPHPKTECGTPESDKLELHIARAALKAKIPLFGICRGLQTLTVASGGTLHQHVPDIVPDEQHGVSEGKGYDDLLEMYKHDVLIDENSRAFSILKKRVIQTNSAHHQAAKTVGDGLRISGTSRGGITEVIEHTDPNYFCFAVQSHPEPFTESDLEPLIKAFADAVREYVP